MTETKFEPSNVNVRIKISALWTSMLFVFAYVDLFSLYRPDFRADIVAGEIAGFTINEALVTIVAGTIGEWSYYILGSVIEAALLAAIVYYAWTWPKGATPASATGT